MEAIRVFARVRADEITSPDDACVITENKTITIFRPSTQTSVGTEEKRQLGYSFVFDEVFPPGASQDSVFQSVLGLIDESLRGFNVTIFAYGMTGSGKLKLYAFTNYSLNTAITAGKTHTITGTYEQPGILLKSVHRIFDTLQQESSNDVMSMVTLSYVELYNNVLYDLLSPHQQLDSDSSPLKLHESPSLGVILTGSPGLRTPVFAAEEALELIARGNRLRATSSTQLNDRSSRSHVVIIFDIISKDFSTGEEVMKSSRINLVDLAGSERLKMSGAEGLVKDETRHINKALTCLGDVLNALSKHHLENQQLPPGHPPKPLGHVPYRDSKLTMLLKSSLGGNTKTVMLATIRNSSVFYQQSLITLRYAARARHIKNVPVKNINVGQNESSSELVVDSLREKLTEIEVLRNQLASRNAECNRLNDMLEKLNAGQAGLGADIATQKEEYEKQLRDLRSKTLEDHQTLKNRLKYVIMKRSEKFQSELDYKEEKIAELTKLQANSEIMRERAEMTNKELLRKLRESQHEINLLRKQNSELAYSQEGMLGADYSTADKVSTKENELLNSVQQSRDAYKSKAEELRLAYDELRELLNFQWDLTRTLALKTYSRLSKYDEHAESLKKIEGWIHYCCF
jgi:hypothetical protein